MGAKYDFQGYATKNDLRCSDGRTIRKDAFAAQDGVEVPLVWQHRHDSPEMVLGKALLEHRSDGMYCYGSFNKSELAQHAKELVNHGDIVSLSICANQLKQKGGDVLHGVIREVSLVLAGANPGAYIEFPVLTHSGDVDYEDATIYVGSDNCALGIYHESSEKEEEEVDEEEEIEEEINHEDQSEEDETMAETGGKTIKEIYDSMTEEQKEVCHFLVGKAVEDATGGNAGDEEIEHDAFGDDDMSRDYNVFENETDTDIYGDTLTHSEMMTIINDAKRCGSLKASVLEHADEYGIENIDYLFPEARTQGNTPDFIKRDTTWVSDFLGEVHKTPFSRVKSIHANITGDEARAKGYIKGYKKLNEVFTLLKRKTEPTTIYKKQKIDRDDQIDITDFDVVAWIKSEMRIMLDEELARAALVSDGRQSAAEDKIDEACIRPIWKDEELYAVHVKMTMSEGYDEDDLAKAFIRAVIKNRKEYKGSGNPVLYTTEDMLTNMLLLTDGNGRDMYDSVEKLATKLRVRKIVTVPVMEGCTRTVAGKVHELLAILVNPRDYTMGADKGGSVNMFEDFDIDYNQEKYLIETRCSGALTVPKSAMVIELDKGDAEEEDDEDISET